MAFKGVLPSDLWGRYDCEGGQQLLELDLVVASEINDRIGEATKDAKRDGKSMVARRNQKRELLNDNKDLFKALRDANVPIEGSNESGDSE
mgnify:FL=1|jgi:hypothetical protein